MVIDLIQVPDERSDELVRRIPESGSGEFRLGSQLVVRENQRAVFFRDGKALDVFGPGRHTISTNNIPFLTGIIGALTGGTSMFTAEVYFVSMREFIDMRWGTSQPVAYRDADLGMVRLRAFGTYSMRVDDPQLFVNQLVGSRGAYATGQIEEFLRGVIINEFNDMLGDAKTPLLDLGGLTKELAQAMQAALTDDFKRLGLQLTSFQIGAITPPEEVQKAIDQRSSMGAIGDMGAFTQYQAAQAMREAANNPGGAGGTAATGVGLGAGVALGQSMAQAMQSATNPPSQPTASGAGASDALAQIERLNELHKSGALNDEEFAAMKAKILGS